MSPDKMVAAQAEVKNDPKIPLANFIVREEQFLSLGQMLNALDVKRGAFGLRGEMRKWLEKKHPQLVDRPASFEGLSRLRNDAAHPSDPFSKAQAEKTYVLCRRVLDILLT